MAIVGLAILGLFLGLFFGLGYPEAIEQEAAHGFLRSVFIKMLLVSDWLMMRSSYWLRAYSPRS